MQLGSAANIIKGRALDHGSLRVWLGRLGDNMLQDLVGERRISLDQLVPHDEWVIDNGTGMEGRDLDQNLLNLGARVLRQELDGEFAPVAPVPRADIGIEAELDVVKGGIAQGLDLEVATNNKSLDSISGVVVLDLAGVEELEHGFNVCS